MRWTPYFETCIQVLKERKDAELDRLLILQVRCHLIMDQVGRARNTAAEEGRPRQLPSYFIEATKLHLRELRAEVSSNLQDNGTS